MISSESVYAYFFLHVLLLLLKLLLDEKLSAVANDSSDERQARPLVSLPFGLANVAAS